MIFDVNLYIQIAMRATSQTSFTFSAQSYTISSINTSWNFYRKCFLIANNALASAGTTRSFNFLTSAVALVAWSLNCKESLLHCSLTSTSTIPTSFNRGTWFCTCSRAGTTGIIFRDSYFDCITFSSLL